MNNRAIDIYKQALEFAYTTVGKEHADTAFFQGTVAGKLAELIVQECAGKVDWILAEGGKTQGGLIREHFGVEE